MPPLAKTQITLLEKLCNAVGVSGDEGAVRRIVLDEVRPHADEVRVDALGNVLVTKLGRGRRRLRVMVDAHMDEVGFMIVAEDGDGLYRFETVGHVDVRYLVGKQVVVGSSRMPGVIGAKPVHLMTNDEKMKKVPLESLRIDVGPGGKVQPGERAGFATRFRHVPPSILSKAIDDRIGVAILIELVRTAPPNIDLCAAFTVQEEIGLRGARVAASFFKPDLAIAVDSTPARDLPAFDGSENMTYNTKLGLGPAIYIADGSSLHNPRLVRFLQETAETEGIPYQFRQPGGGGTNSSAIQRSLAGIRTASVSVPHRYTHSPVSISRVDDWANTLRLLQAALKRITSSLAAAEEELHPDVSL